MAESKHQPLDTSNINIETGPPGYDNAAYTSLTTEKQQLPAAYPQQTVPAAYPQQTVPAAYPQQTSYPQQPGYAQQPGYPVTQGMTPGVYPLGAYPAASTTTYVTTPVNTQPPIPNSHQGYAICLIVFGVLNIIFCNLLFGIPAVILAAIAMSTRELKSRMFQLHCSLALNIIGIILWVVALTMLILFWTGFWWTLAEDSDWNDHDYYSSSSDWSSSWWSLSSYWSSSSWWPSSSWSSPIWNSWSSSSAQNSWFKN